MKPRLSFDQFRSRYAEAIDAQMPPSTPDHFRGAKMMKALSDVDQMSPGLRACVHEFGSEVVNEIYQCGVTNPTQIRNVVKACWMGARQGKQRPPREGTPRITAQVDWLLMQSGSSLSADTLIRALWLHGWIIIPREPLPQMIAASVGAHLGAGALSKTSKHALRLRAAIKAAVDRLWPHLITDEKS